MSANAEILQSLQREILTLQGFKPASAESTSPNKLGQLNAAFPNGVFPLAAVHEFVCGNAEELAASSGFVSALLSCLLRPGAVCAWVSPMPRLFPPALKLFGLNPDKFIFLHPKTGNDNLWVWEETLKCGTLAAVVGEVRSMMFTESRRLQLAIEKSGVGCFLLYQNAHTNAIASVSRWRIKSLRTESDQELPGLAYPRWHVQLQKVRNGKPADWQMEWREGRFRYASKLTALPSILKQKTG